MQSFLKQLKHHWKTFLAIIKSGKPQHRYRVLSIEKDDHENYVAVIQLVNKAHVFKLKPEEILADDRMTDGFSQRDVRTLTYLGYLDINSPKYKILAKRLSEKDSKLVFAIQEKGKKKPIVKTADEIATDHSFIEGLHQKDAHMVGYTVASEQSTLEAQQKSELLKNSAKKSLQEKSEENNAADIS